MKKEDLNKIVATEVRSILDKYFAPMNLEIYQSEIDSCEFELSEYILSALFEMDRQHNKDKLKFINNLEQIIKGYK